MNLESLKTARHIEEVINHPNPMVMEATKLYLSGQRLSVSAFGSDFIKVYLEIESQMYLVLNNTKKQEDASRKPDILPEETVARASEAPKFKI